MLQIPHKLLVQLQIVRKRRVLLLHVGILCSQTVLKSHCSEMWRQCALLPSTKGNFFFKSMHTSLISSPIFLDRKSHNRRSALLSAEITATIDWWAILSFNHYKKTQVGKAFPILQTSKMRLRELKHLEQGHKVNWKTGPAFQHWFVYGTSTIANKQTNK